MKWLASLLAAVALIAAPLCFGGVNDGASSAAQGKVVLPSEQVASFSKRVEETLAQHGARVAIIARAGRPRSDLPDGVDYTHVAFAVYSMITLSDGSQQPGYAIYNLYQRANAPHRSTLVQDYPFDFFAAVPELRTGIIVPTPQLQQRLLNTISSSTYQKLHNPSYSLVANPFNNQLQNCTEFTLNILQASIYQTDDLGMIKRTLSEHFSPYRLQTNPLKLAAGAAVMKELSLADHNGPVVTTTFSSIAAYLKRYGLMYKKLELAG